MNPGPPFVVLSVCHGGGYRYCRTDPPHPRRNAKGLYPLHRVLAENKIGRLLEAHEIVHHMDGDKGNDAPENLEVLDSAQHSRHHQNEKAPQPVALTCAFCGQRFELRPCEYRRRAKNAANICCSRSCSGRLSHATGRVRLQSPTHERKASHSPG